MAATKKLLQNYATKEALSKAYYQFLDQLWRDGSSLRADIMDAPGLPELKTLLASNGLNVPEEQIVVVDVERGACRKFPDGTAFSEAADFYVMILPPRPQKTGSHSPLDPYQQAKAWSAALYHAQAESYGM